MLDKAKPTQLFGIPREVLIAYNNSGLDAKIANARRPGDMDKLVWERTMLHFEIARLAHQAAQTYCVGKNLSAAVNPFEGERIRMANEWLSALMGGPLPERLNFDAETVKALCSHERSLTGSTYDFYCRDALPTYARDTEDLLSFLSVRMLTAPCAC